MSAANVTKGLRNGLNHCVSSWMGAAACCVALAAAGSSGLAQSDNFDDGNDTGWMRYDPIGSHPALPDIASFSVVNQAYRIRSTPSPLPTQVGPSRAGAIRQDVTYTDFYVAIDLVDWDETQEQSVGLLARVKEIGLGSTDGYVLTYNFRGKDIDITRFTDEDPANGNLRLTGDDSLELVKGKKYRLVFWGIGTDLGARVYDLANPETPLVNVTASDATYASGYCGILVYDNSADASKGTDATFDNYLALTEEPPKLEAVDLGFGLIHVRWPGRASGYTLEYTDDLSAPRWTPVLDETAISYFSDIDRYVYAADGSSGNQFFRLVKR